MTKRIAVPVSLRAVIQRINRKLRASGEVLKTARSTNVASSVGWHYIVDTDNNWISSQRVDPEALARELGVLQDYETVVES
jgi:hypothetical protein